VPRAEKATRRLGSDLHLAMPITLDALADELLVRVRAVVREQVQSVAGMATSRPEGFFNTESAARYLDSTEEAVRTAVKRGKLNPARRGTGRNARLRRNARLLFTRDQLDAYARGEAA
jgi:hypothetical protein